MENLEQIGIYELEEDGGIREKLFLSKNVKAVAFQQRFQAKCGISCIVIWLFVLIPYEGDGEHQPAAFSDNPVYFLTQFDRIADILSTSIAQARIEYWKRPVYGTTASDSVALGVLLIFPNTTLI